MISRTYGIFGCLSLLLVVLTALAVQAQDAAQVQENVEAIRREMDDLRQQIANLEQREQSETKSLENLNHQIYLREKLVKRYAVAETRLQRALHSTEKEIAEKSKQLDLQRATLATQLVHLYLHGRTPYLSALMNADDVTQAAMQMRYLKYFLDFERRRIDSAQALISDLRTKRSQVANGYRENRRLRRAEEQEKTSLNKKRQEKDRKRKELSNSIEAAKANLRDKQQSLTQLEARLTRLMQEARESREQGTETHPSGRVAVRQDPLNPPVPFSALKGKLPYPVEGSVVENYGMVYNEQLKTRLQNPGVTIDAKPGGVVRAIGYGRVSEVTYMPGYGPMLILQHDDEYVSVYSPITDITVNIGQVVQKGAVIGRVGENGLGETNRFSLMVFRNGRHVNPLAWISRNIVARR